MKCASFLDVLYISGFIANDLSSGGCESPQMGVSFFLLLLGTSPWKKNETHWRTDVSVSLRIMLEAFWRLCWGPLEILWEPSGGVGTEDFRGPKTTIPFEREAYFQESARYCGGGVGEGAR